MKKKIISIISLLATICIAVGCGASAGTNGPTPNSTDSSSSLTPDSSTDLSTESTSGGDNYSDDIFDDSTSGSTDDNTIPDDESSGSGTPDTPEIPDDEKAFTAFTTEEQALYAQYVGEAIPFLPNDEYAIETFDVEQPENYWDGIYFYCEASEAEFEEYRKLFTAYTLDETVTDDLGDTWYVYVKGTICIEMTHYEEEGVPCAVVYAYNTDYISRDPDGFTYTDFNAEEIEIFEDSVNAVIPFMPTDEYYLEGLTEGTYLDGLSLVAYDNTPAEFVSYQYTLKNTGFKLTDTYTARNKTWYVYEKGTLAVEVCHYHDGWGYVVEMRITDSVLSFVNTEQVDTGTLLINNGKGLPTDESGVYNLDFTNTAYTKDATEQGLYLNGCPTKGNVKVLVIPVEFSDATAESKGYDIQRIRDVFNEVKDEDDFFSVKEYYAISSAGQLNLEFTVMDSWFRPQYESTHYMKIQLNNGGYMMDLGEQLVINEALAHYSQTLDLSDFDSDDNGTIDAVICINTMEIKTKPSFQWAFRYWNIYTDERGNFYTYDGVRANDYMWAAYNFLQHKPYNQYDCDNSYPLNSYTYVHEFGHILGSEDYYDTGYVLPYEDRPLAGKDVMDAIYGDHNPFTKFHYGWLTTSRLIVAEKSVTVTLENFQKTGDTIIIANNWDERLGAYQEYYVLMYYRVEGLNNDTKTYFNKDGIMVYHVNASLVEQKYDNTVTYDVYNNNTTEGTNNGYGTKENLIELVKNAKGSQLFTVGDSINANEKDDYGNSLLYNFTVDSLSGDTATLTFYKQTKDVFETDDKKPEGGLTDDTTEALEAVFGKKED